MKWVEKLKSKLAALQEALVDPDYNMAFYYEKDDWGGLRLVINDYEAFYKHYERQFEACRQLRELQENERSNRKTNT